LQAELLSASEAAKLAQRRDLESHLASSRAEAKEKADRAEKLAEKLKGLQGDARDERSPRFINEFSDDYDSQIRENAALKGEVKELTSSLASNEEERLRLSFEVEESVRGRVHCVRLFIRFPSIQAASCKRWEEELQEMRATKDEAEMEIKATNRRAEKAEEELAKAVQDLSKVAEDHAALEARLQAANADSEGLRNSLEEAKSDASRLEKAAEASKVEKKAREDQIATLTERERDLRASLEDQAAMLTATKSEAKDVLQKKEKECADLR